jgi:hypothetical protein
VAAVHDERLGCQPVANRSTGATTLTCDAHRRIGYSRTNELSRANE